MEWHRLYRWRQCTRSATITISAGTAVVTIITPPPESQAVTAALSYQRLLHGATPRGATSATLSLTGVTMGQAGSDACRVTNVAGSVTCSAAILNMNYSVAV